MKRATGSVYRSGKAWIAKVSWSDPTVIDPKTQKAKRRWRKARAVSKAAAASARDRLLRDLFDSRGTSEVIETFADLARAYVDAHCHAPVYENGVKLHGIKDHRGVRAIITNVFVPKLGNRFISAITYPELKSIRDGRLTAPKLHGGRKTVETKGQRSIARVNREFAVLRSVLNYAVDLRVIERNPMNAGRGKSLVVLSAETPRDRVMSSIEEKALLAAFKAEKILRSRDFIIALIDTGLRFAELSLLEFRDIDTPGRAIRLRWETTKNKKPRTVPLSSRLEAIVTSRRNDAPAGARVFEGLSYTIVRDDFRQARQAAGLLDLRIHDLRTTFATRLLQRGWSEREIARMTGHTVNRVNVAPTLGKHYLHLDSDALIRAAATLDGFHKTAKAKAPRSRVRRKQPATTIN